jgi:hypothetical protein
MSDDKMEKPATNTPQIPEQPQAAKKTRKKPPLIDFNALDAHQQKTMHSIANAGARIANAQQKVREAQLRAMKTTLDEIFSDPDGADADFINVLFRGLLDKASAPNAKKIASHPLCPADLAERHQPAA